MDQAGWRSAERESDTPPIDKNDETKGISAKVNLLQSNK
jgi:hypothetical protein